MSDYINSYIKRIDALDAINERREAAQSRGDDLVAYTANLDFLDVSNLPSADVEPVRHGAWKEVLAGLDYEYECTRCKACVEQEYPYCPNCGAKMDGKEQENEQG